MDSFYHGHRNFVQDLQLERTDGWEGDMHYCRFDIKHGLFLWSAWECGSSNDFRIVYWEGQDHYDRDCMELGMLLDLDSGTLSVYQNCQRFGTVTDGLAGEYCWLAGVHSAGDVSIQRGYK